MRKRRRAYIWVTWICGLLAGDDQCKYAAWFKAWHRDYRHRPGSGDLSKWKAEHADLVERRRKELAASGFDVRVENENKFTVQGETATLSAGPDLLVLGERMACIEDCKTGRQRDAHVWQVLIYMLFMPRPPHVTAELGGALVYADGTRQQIRPELADATARARVGVLVREIAQRDPPAAAPSAAECRYCDIDECPFRAAEADVPQVKTEAF